MRSVDGKILLKEKFLQAREKILYCDRERRGIGMLKEKSMHAILKLTLEPNEMNHEIKMGKYVADIVNDDGVIEIQTRNFNAMRDKLTFFLQTEQVTIVYPIPHIKYLLWIDEESGEISKRRKSPKKGEFYDAFYELYKIKQWLTHPNLKIKLLLIDTEEYRNLNGWSRDKKRGSSRHEMIPTDIFDIFDINCKEDYQKLVPRAMPQQFTTKDYKEASKRTIEIARIALNVLKYVGAIEQVGKKGNTIVYERNKSSYPTLYYNAYQHE